MSAAEKALNKDDLFAYKHNDGRNYAMIPGIQSSSQINTKRQSAATSPQASSGLTGKLTEGLTKKVLDTNEKLNRNTDRFKQYGAGHLGEEISQMTHIDKKQYLGQGNLLNGAQDRKDSPLKNTQMFDPRK